MTVLTKSSEPNRGKVVRRPPTRLKRVWIRIRQPIARSWLFKHALAGAIVAYLRLVKATNRKVTSVEDNDEFVSLNGPLIVALWHGQHLLSPVYWPRRHPAVAMLSRSADAELNAIAVNMLGIEAVRGSGGREEAHDPGKGGARALIGLKKALEQGKNALMIADIPHGQARQAGLGIVTLARLSGRPIVPVAITTSRRRVLESTWDKTVINLPFGRAAAVPGPLIYVPADADDAMMESKRRELTEALNAVTHNAQALVDKRS